MALDAQHIVLVSHRSPWPSGRGRFVVPPARCCHGGCAGAGQHGGHLDRRVLLVVTVTLIRPAWGLVLLALAVPFGSVRELSLGTASIGVAEALAALVIVAWIARMAALREFYVARSRLWLPLALLLVTMLLSVTGALSLGSSIKELIKWLEFAAIMICAASLISPAERKLVVASALIAGIAAGLLGWYQFLAGVGPPGFMLFGRFMRAYGTFRQPNPYAGYLGIILPVAVALVTAYWPWGRQSDRGWFRSDSMVAGACRRGNRRAGHHHELVTRGLVWRRRRSGRGRIGPRPANSRHSLRVGIGAGRPRADQWGR